MARAAGRMKVAAEERLDKKRLASPRSQGLHTMPTEEMEHLAPDAVTVAGLNGAGARTVPPAGSAVTLLRCGVAGHGCGRANGVYGAVQSSHLNGQPHFQSVSRPLPRRIGSTFAGRLNTKGSGATWQVDGLFRLYWAPEAPLHHTAAGATGPAWIIEANDQAVGTEPQAEQQAADQVGTAYSYLQ